jgi:hypothetical protein
VDGCGVKSYLVELHLPAGDPAELAAAGERARTAAEQLTREGTAVRWVRSAYVKTLALPAILLFLVGGALALANPGGDGDGDGTGGAAARSAPNEPVVVALKPAHNSGVSGTARLAPDGANLMVTVTLSKRVPATLPAHIHTGPCSDEPTLKSPRIWALLTDVIDGGSETTVNVATLKELQAESSSINVHDPDHANRPLVCGDIPPAS